MHPWNVATPADAALKRSLSAVSRDISADCVLMFSGGRDSTLAALRLNDTGQRLVLVTVTSGHLVGLDRVRQRLGEMARRLPPDTPWMRVRQPEELGTDTSFYDQTCLPCHHAYVVVSVVIARALGASRLAFGYAGYQSGWPEQTPLAVSRLAGLLERHGIELVLPVYGLRSREEAVQELATRALGSDSLEQKCLRQVSNVALDEARLAQQVELWEKAIETSMAVSPPLDAEVLELTTVAKAQTDPADVEQQPHGKRGDGERGHEAR